MDAFSPRVCQRKAFRGEGAVGHPLAETFLEGSTLGESRGGWHLGAGRRGEVRNRGGRTSGFMRTPG
jgi:hypothetical protein